MKTSLVIVLVVLIVVSTLAIMNNACKSGQHDWCAPINDPKVKQQFLELKRLWLLLARRCEFNKA